MSARPQQLAFDLVFRAALGREDFLVGDANQAAVAAIDAWHSWPQRAMAIAGPAGAGKSHLVEVWRAASGALRTTGAALSEATVSEAATSGAIAVEDIDRGIEDQRVLFHLFNLAREGRLSLLVTSRVLPGELDVALPDLRSRLRAMALARIEPPDESLLRALLVKQLADRQLSVEPDVIGYVMQRMERSADAARRFVAALDRQALATRRSLSKRLAGEVLDGLAEAE